MTRADSRRGAAAGGSVGLMVAAFLCFAGFIYWLSQTAAPSDLQLTDAEGAGADDPRAAAQFVAIDNFAGNPIGYEGRLIHLVDVPVSSALGSSLVWLELPNDVLYLVRMPADAVTSGMAPARGQMVEVVGTVGTMTPEILDEWVTNGVVSEDDRIEAEFATSFMNLDFISVTGMAPQNESGQ